MVDTLKGFKGYDFDANEQPRTVLEWETTEGATIYTVFRRGIVGPIIKFMVCEPGQRIEYTLTPRSWITHLYPHYPKLTHPGYLGTAADVIRARRRQVRNAQA